MADVTVANTTSGIAGKTIACHDVDGVTTGVWTFANGVAVKSGPTGTQTWRLTVDGAGTLQLTADGMGAGLSLTPAGATHVGALTVDGGVTFPTPAVPSPNVTTLDDYREGPWTPYLVGSTTPGVHTYAVQTGYYVKVGRVVTVSFAVTLSAKDPATSGTYANITGLPFPFANIPNLFYGGVCSYYGAIGTHPGLILQAQANSSKIYFVDANQNYMSAADIGTNAYVTASLTYLTD